MASPIASPDAAFEVLLNCTQQHLATRTEVPPPNVILIGANGVDKPYGCCEGTLVIESLGPMRFAPGFSGPGTVDGCNFCDAVFTNEYRVTYARCAPAFDSQRVDGAPTNVASRNDLAIATAQEAWLLFQALVCCIDCEYNDVYQANHSIVDTCAKFWVDIRMQHPICCEDRRIRAQP